MVVLTQPVKARSLVDELVERLEHAIMTGELAGGTLLREQTLARSLGVSRGPLREAIRQLEGRMLLQRKPNVGASVVELSQKDLKEIWVLREALEGIACGLAAANITDEEIAALERIVEFQERDLRSDNWGHTYEGSPEFDFHYKIMQASRNQRLVQLICGDLHYLLKVYRYRGTSANLKRASDALVEHRTILKALAKRDPVQAEAAMRAHIRKSLENFLKGNHIFADEIDLNAIPMAPPGYNPKGAKKANIAPAALASPRQAGRKKQAARA